MEQFTKSSIFQTSLRNVELTADRLNLDDAVRQRLLGAKEKIELRITPMMPTGHIKVIKAFIVKHQDALGPAKGGIRMTPEVTMGDIAGLAMEMTWKTALSQVEQRLAERMERQFNDVFEYARNNGLNLRQAAMDIAVGRVAEAILARGLLP